MVNIVPMMARHLDAVVRLHITYLRTNYRGFAGKQLLIRYYTTLIETDAACGYAALEDDCMAGFVCGVWDAAGVRSALLKQHLPSLLLWGALQSLNRPAMLGLMVRRLTTSWKSKDSQKTLPQLGYELRPIVVDPDFRGTGVAQKLVDRLIRDADQRGFERLFLYTEEDNAVANAFYCKVGFEFVSKHRVGQTVYVRYEIPTSEKIT